MCTASVCVKVRGQPQASVLTVYHHHHAHQAGFRLWGGLLTASHFLRGVLGLDAQATVPGLFSGGFDLDFHGKCSHPLSQLPSPISFPSPYLFLWLPPRYIAKDDPEILTPLRLGLERWE